MGSDILGHSILEWNRNAIVAKREGHELTELARERIVNVVRSLADDRVDRGIDLGRAMHCDSCDQDKAPAGSTLYGAYKLCNDCLVDFTLALASGTVENVAEYMTRRSDEPVDLAPPPDLNTIRDRQSLGNRQTRDKFMPGHEPA